MEKWRSASSTVKPSGARTLNAVSLMIRPEAVRSPDGVTVGDGVGVSLGVTLDLGAVGAVAEGEPDVPEAGSPGLVQAVHARTTEASADPTRRRRAGIRCRGWGM